MDNSKWTWTIRGQNLTGSGVSARVVSDDVYSSDRTFTVNMKTLSTTGSSTTCCTWYVAWATGKYIDEYQRSVFVLHTSGLIEFNAAYGGAKTTWMVQTTLSPFDFHKVQLAYSGNNATVYVDNVLYLDVSDPNIGLLGGSNVQLASWGTSSSTFKLPVVS